MTQRTREEVVDDFHQVNCCSQGDCTFRLKLLNWWDGAFDSGYHEAEAVAHAKCVEHRTEARLAFNRGRLAEREAVVGYLKALAKEYDPKLETDERYATREAVLGILGGSHLNSPPTEKP